MISLTLDNRQLPLVFLVDTFSLLTVLTDGERPVSSSWAIYTGSGTVAQGVGDVRFNPATAVTHYIHVSALALNGISQENIFTVQVSVRRPVAVEVSAQWDSIDYTEGDTLHAKILFRDPEGARFSSLRWTFFRNNVLVAEGTSLDIEYADARYGCYRLKVTAVDGFGATVTGDSSVHVQGDFESQSAVLPVQPDPTLVYLGSVFSFSNIGEGGVVTALPYQLASFNQEVFLLPGTTHIKIEVDNGEVPDEVVVRTSLGNWLLVGSPGGLTDESVGYDYQPNQPYIPVPVDLRWKATFDLFKVHGFTADGFNFRIRFKCYRQSPKLYQYERCPYSITPGGAGNRARRFALLFTEIDMAVDAESNFVEPSAKMFTTPMVTEAPVVLMTSGIPDVIDEASGMFFTDANLLASYEPIAEGVKEVDAKAIFAWEGYRPFCMTLTMPGSPPIVQRPKRLGGKLVVYMANGALNSGAVVNVGIITAGGSGLASYNVPVMADNQSPDENTFVKVAEITINLSDGTFAGFGIVASIALDETNSESESLPVDCAPDPVWLDETIHAPYSGSSVSLDGACYTHPQLVEQFNGSRVYSVDSIVGCHALLCGPVGLYCYSQLNGGGTYAFPQPFGFPAPILAFATNIADCYGNPSLIDGGTISALPMTPPFLAFSGSNDCGTAYRFVACSGNGDSFVSIYPLATIPPSVVSYQGTCWSESGTITDTSSYSLINRSSLSSVFDCQDAICTNANGTGLSVQYTDFVTNEGVNVRFEHLNTGIPHFAVAPQTIDDGHSFLPTGSISLHVTDKKCSFTILNSILGTGTLNFVVSKSAVNLLKFIVRVRGSSEVIYPIVPGLSTIGVSVQPDDKIRFQMNKKNNLNVIVSWAPEVIIPRLYQTSILSFSGSVTLSALGFTGMSVDNQYAFYGTLPADSANTVVNPDSVVTAQGDGGSELVLIRARALGDPVPVIPNGLSFYAGQTLQSPITFRFYAARRPSGGHGEMDAWLSSAGTLPTYLKVSEFKALVRPVGFYRRNDEISDTSRNSLRVVTDISSYGWPNVYASSTGAQIVVSGLPAPSTLNYHGVAYNRTGTAPGLAYHLVQLSATS